MLIRMKMEKQRFVLAEVDNLSVVSSPLKSTQRIKYTSFTVSQNFLIFGATSGGLYVFRRLPCCFLQLIPNKEGGVTHISISPDEKLFAFSTVKGTVCLLERNAGAGARRVQLSTEHQGSEVTTLQWNTQSNELYIGDDTGKISIIAVSYFVAKTMFQTPTFHLMQLDSRVVQLDYQADRLLVSTMTRCYVCDTVQEQYRQVGNKLRDGEFGACFCGSETQDLKSLRMFCARPGSRVWEVNLNGNVLRTHQFKEALATSPTSIIHLTDGDNTSELSSKENPDVCWGQQSFNFSKLHTLDKKYLFTYKKDGIYIFDTNKANVVLWSNGLQDILDAKVFKDTVYLWTGSGKIHAILCSPLEDFLVKLYFRKEYKLCARLCDLHVDYLLTQAPSSSKLHLLADLGTRISDDFIRDKIQCLLDEIAKWCTKKKNVMRLESGIFLVGNSHFLPSSERKPRIASNQITELKPEKSRSLSSSPNAVRKVRNVENGGGLRNGVNKIGSTSSLPDLGLEEAETCKPSQLQRNGSDAAGCVSDQGAGLSSYYELPTEMIFPPLPSPETFQALKDIGHSVSGKIVSGTKTLKQKWQFLEQKIKLGGTETTMGPLEIDPVETPDDFGEEAVNFDEDEEQITQSISWKVPRPALDVATVTNLCAQLVDNPLHEDLLSTLFCNINSICVQYQEALRPSQSTNHSDTKQALENTEYNNTICNSFCALKNVTPFPFKLYFDKIIIKQISDIFHIVLQNKLVCWLKECVFTKAEYKKFPEQFQNVYAEEDLILDVLVSKILEVYRDLLSPKSVLQCLTLSGLRCYFRSLCVVLDIYQKGSSNYSREGDAGEEEWPLPLLLNAICMMLRLDQVDTCCKMCEKVQVREIFYLILKVQEERNIENEHEQITSKLKSHSTFLSFLEKLCASDVLITESFQHSDLQSFMLLAFEQLNLDLTGVCVCGFPWCEPTSVQFASVGDTLLGLLWNTDQSRALDLCRKVPAMWRTLLSLWRGNAAQPALRLALHLADVTELQRWAQSAELADWRAALSLLGKLYAGECLNCGARQKMSQQVHRLSWNTMGNIMVKVLGSNQTLELLLERAADIPRGQLDMRFYQSCILSAMVDSRREGLRSSVMEILNQQTDPNSCKAAVLSSKLTSEVESALRKDLGQNVSLLAPSPEHHHWGTTVDLATGVCPCCTLPLSSLVLLSNGGLVVFPCSHTYHTVCVRQRQSQPCLLCQKDSEQAV